MALDDLVNYAILIAVAVAIILMVTGKFIDLSIERQTSVQSRATINLLQNIVTESPILMTDSNGNKLKLVIDKLKYVSKDLIECCDSVQYDYKFGVGEYEEPTKTGFNAKPVDGMQTKTNYVSFSGDFHLEDPCYTEFGIGLKSSAKVPVNVCEGSLNDCKQGIASIETTDTPLSELSYWIAQACSYKFPVSKRIPLSLNDYASEDDIKVDNSNREICLHDNCKKFSCDGNVQTLVDSDLFEQPVPGSIFALKLPQKCSFAKVVRDSSGTVSVVQAKSQEIPPGVEIFSVPENKDAWTEDEDSYFSRADNYLATNDPTLVPSIKPAVTESKKYIVLVSKDGITSSSNVHDKPITLNLNKVPEAADCGGTNCIDMKKLGLDKIFFRAKIFTGGEGSTGYLRWKLSDVNGRCIEKDYSFGGGLLGPLGPKVRDLVTTDWKPFEIDLFEGAEADDVYGDCNDQSADKLTPGFTWKIKTIEWSVCERNLAGIACATEQLDSTKALAIDNLYFRGIKNEQ